MSHDISITGQITPEQIPQFAEQGFKTIINNRPDGEEPNQPTSAELAAAVDRQWPALLALWMGRLVVLARSACIGVARPPHGGVQRACLQRPAGGLAPRLAGQALEFCRNRQAAGVAPVAVTDRPPAGHGQPVAGYRWRIAPWPTPAPALPATGAGT